MDKIMAKYISDCDSGKRDGSGRVTCPFCSEVCLERDIEQYSEEGSGRLLEMCSDCREGFERDFEMAFESDVLAPDTFGRLLAEVSEQEENAGLNEETAEQVARVLGGSAWQSGGGIWLVRIRRKDGRLVVISDDMVGEYASDSDFDAGKAEKVVLLA